jgi:hypothetical protein
VDNPDQAVVNEVNESGTSVDHVQYLADVDDVIKDSFHDSFLLE